MPRRAPLSGVVSLYGKCIRKSLTGSFQRNRFGAVKTDRTAGLFEDPSTQTKEPRYSRGVIAGHSRSKNGVTSLA
jgi:hypothetical protein